MSVGFFGVADRQVLLPLGLVMSCAKSCPSDFSGRRADVFARVWKCRPILSRERGHFNEQRRTTPEKNERTSLFGSFWAEQKEQMID